MSHQNPAATLINKPIRGSLSAIALALMTSLALNGVVTSVYNLHAEYAAIIASQESQLAAALASQNKQPTTATEKIENRKPEATNRIIVKYKEDAKLPPGLSVAAERANLEKAQGLVKVLTIAGINADVYTVSDDDDSQEVVDRLLATKSDLIEYAEVDMKVFPAYIPNDPYLTNAISWHHAKIASREAWDIAKGEGVTIAILDTGTNCTHPDLAPNCIPGWNIYANSSSTTNFVNAHGTMVAGNAASRGDNGQGGSGIAYNSKILPVKITNDDGSSTCSVIAGGITYAADQGARVASNSFFVHGCLVTNDASRYLESKGGVSVRAAGNTGTSEDSYVVPLNEVVHVSATNQSDVRTSWSSYGQFVDISAPGQDVYCTAVNGGYGSCWGTSFSVPTVSGVFALMFSANPNLTATQAKNILFTTTDDLGEPGWDMYYGHGRVNAAKAVAAALATVGAKDTVPPSTPTNLRQSNLTAGSVTLTWNAATDDNSGVAGYSIYRSGTKLATIAGTSYTSTGLSPLTTYTYTVKAEDAQGNVSPDSTPLTITTPDVTFGIATYQVPTKTATTATVATTLTKPGTVTVKYGTSATNLTSTVTSTTANLSHTLSLTNLTAATTYYYQVTATDGTTTVTTPVSSFKTNKATGGGKPRR